MENAKPVGAAPATVPETPSLLIAIPTFNRATVVLETVGRLREIVSESGNWGVLVVDNNSSDGTFELLSGEFATWEKFTVVKEYEAGSSAARNRAIDECKADYIHFLDDECLVEHDFVDRVFALIKERKPLMYGGPVYPRYNSPMPWWYFDELGCMSVPTMTGRSNRISISGPNMGFEIEALRAAGGFDPLLGLHGDNLGYGEETDVELKLVARHGYDRMAFCRDLKVFHLTLPEKFILRRVLKANFRRGIARGLLSEREHFHRALSLSPSLEFRPDPRGPARRGLVPLVVTTLLGVYRQFGYRLYKARLRRGKGTASLFG